MIRFSASLVVVAIGLLVAGVVTSRLLLVYLAIAISAVALIALAIGVFLRREELFGQPVSALPAGPGIGLPGAGPPPARDMWGGGPAEAGSFPDVRPADIQPFWAAGRFSGPAERPFLTGPAPSAGHAEDTAAWHGDFPGRTAEPAMRPGETLVWPRDAEDPGGGDRRPGEPRPLREDQAGWPEGPEDRPPWSAPGTYTYPGDRDTWQAPGARQGQPSVPAAQASRDAGPPETRDAPPAQRPGSATPEGGAPDSAGRQVPQGPGPVRPAGTPGPARPDAATSSAAPDAGASRAEAPKAGASKAEAPKSGVARAAAPDAGAPGTASDSAAPDAAPDAAAPEAPAAGAAAPDAAPAGAGAPAGRDVKVVPGVPRFHRGDCILIRFMGDDDLETMSLAQAREAGCTPCRACQPDSTGTPA